MLEDKSAPKPGQAAKLKLTYLGPYVITEILDRFNYRLQRLATGKDLQRPVHGSCFPIAKIKTVSE